MGTTKTTSHLPGYCGFLPKTDINPSAIGQGKGEQKRETIIKQNIVENYTIKIPGYAGYKNVSAMNDRGQARPNCLSTMGETFH